MPQKKTRAEVGEGFGLLAGRVKAGCARGLKALSPYGARIAGLALGIWGSWYGMAAGFLIGYMVDAAREGRLFRARLKNPAAATDEGLRPGLAAAGGIALSADWPHAADSATRMGLFLGLARSELGLSEPEARRLGRFLSAAELEIGLPFPAFSRELAAAEAPECRVLLASFAYALFGEAGQDLSHEAEFHLRRILADSGCGLEEIAGARRTAFPAYRDPWELLGIEAGASEREIRKAWKQKGARLHPDAGRGGAEEEAGGTDPDPTAEFRAVREAYEFLGRRGR